MQLIHSLQKDIISVLGSPIIEEQTIIVLFLHSHSWGCKQSLCPLCLWIALIACRLLLCLLEVAQIAPKHHRTSENNYHCQVPINLKWLKAQLFLFKVLNTTKTPKDSM